MNNSQFVVNRYSHLCITFISLVGISQLKAAAPEASSVSATRVTYFEAKLNARVNPKSLSTTISFEFGITTSYGNSVSITGTSSGSVTLFKSITVSGLIPGSVYHYRVKSVNKDGTTYGKDRVFVTGSNFSKSSHGNQSIYVGDNGLVYSCGSNSYGQLGDSTKTNRTTPVQVLKGAYSGTKYLGDNKNNPIIAVSSGANSNMALAADGTVYTWGDNTYGQLGDNTKTATLTPVQVLKGAYSGTTYLGDNKNNPIITIFGSVFHNIALAADGTVFTWGYNGYYELGDNTYIDKSTPIQPLTGAYNGTTYLGDNKNNPIVSVFANVYHNIALAADGSVYTWGYNGWGNLGDGTTNDGKTPLQVLNGAYSGTSYLGDNSNNPIIGVSVGKYHSMALAADGTVYTWGWNPYGQLGDNTTTDKSTPEKVLKGDYSGTNYLGDNTSNPIISVFGGTYHSSAMAVNGTVYTWGYNGYGQLGDNTKTSRATPVQVLKGAYSGTTYMGDSKNNPIIAVSSGETSIAVMADDGTVYAWGDNGYGQLGDNTTTNKSTPVKVLGVGGSGVLDLITYIPKNFLGSDIKSCGVNDKKLSSSINFSKYKWSTGVTTATITVISTGSYILEGSNSAGDKALDTIFVSIINGKISPKDTLECSGKSVIMRANETGTSASNAKYPLKYKWSTNDTGKTTLVNTLGVSKIKVTISNGLMTCKDSTTLRITNTKFNFNKDTLLFTACVKDSMRLSIGKPWREVRWGNSQKDSIRKDSVIYLKTTDQYRVRVKDSLGCYAYDTIYFLNPGPLWTSVDSVFNLNCYRDLIGRIYTTSYDGFKPYTYQWNDSKQSTTTKLEGIARGNYMLVVKDFYGCTDTLNQNIGSPSEMLLTLSRKDTVKCYGGSDGSIVTNISGGTWPYRYQWNDINKQTTATAKDLSAATYKVVGTDAIGCKDSIKVELLGPARTLKIKASDTVVCQGAMITLTGIGAKTYFWYDDGRHPAGIKNGVPFDIYSSSGKNIYKLTGINAIGCVDTLRIEIVVNDLPKIDTMYGPTKTIAPNTTYNYSVTQKSGESYSWLVSNGSIVSGQGTNAVGIQWAGDGLGSVSVIATNANKCIDTAVLQTLVGGVAVKEFGKSSQFQIYPNPTNGQFILEGENLNNASVVVMDMLGKVVDKRVSIQGNQADFSTSDWAKGIYTVVITQGDAKATKKLVVY